MSCFNPGTQLLIQSPTQCNGGGNVNMKSEKIHGLIKDSLIFKKENEQANKNQ